MRQMRALILGGVVFLSCGFGYGQQSPKAETLEVTEEAGSYVLTVPVSRLVMKFPKGGLDLVRNPTGGATGSPRYFYFEDRGRALFISGWFEAEARFSGIKKFWADETAAWKKKGLPKAEDVVFAEFGHWNAVIYDVRIPIGRHSHIRAHWLQAGTWIDIHLSRVADLPQKELRAELRDVLDNIQVTEKPSGASAAAQTSSQLHDYVVPGHGRFSLLVPTTWTDFSKPLEQPPSVSVRFQPPSGDMFLVQVTVVWLDAGKLAALNPESLKSRVQQSSVRSLAQSVEKEAKLEELRGEQTLGYYYSLTDRAPPPEEYKYLTQGISRTGELMIVFTILHREDDIHLRTMALKMFANATYSK